MNYIKFESKNRIRGANFIFIWFLILNVISFKIMFYSPPSPSIPSLAYLSFIFMGFYIVLSRWTSRIEFKGDLCYLSTPPFLKHKHKITKTTFIFYDKLSFVKFKEPFYKLPFYMIMLNDDEEEKLNQYIDQRNDIRKKLI